MRLNNGPQQPIRPVWNCFPDHSETARVPGSKENTKPIPFDRREVLQCHPETWNHNQYLAENAQLSPFLRPRSAQNKRHTVVAFVARVLKEGAGGGSDREHHRPRLGE